MTAAEAEALGRRWLAAGGQTLPGMLLRPSDPNRAAVRVVDPDTGVRLANGDARMYSPTGTREDATPWATWWPDLRDAATRGACLEVVRERWGSPAASLVNERVGPPQRWAMLFLGGSVVHGATESEALVAALESAPKVGS